jgi:hypothetical protein
MSDELGTAVVDVVEPSQADISADAPNESTDVVDGKPKEPEQEKQDGRKQPDALKKHIADLRRQAESIVDPVEKKAALDRIKYLYDVSGKAKAYEEQFPTVREVREVKALLDTVGGRDGVIQMQSLLSEVEQIDQQLAAGDAKVIDRMWQEAPEGMPKLIPAFVDRFAKEKPQEYEQFIAPKSIGYLDQQGFPQAFDRMVQEYEAGNKDVAARIKDQLIQWVQSTRQQVSQQQQKQADPEVERLRQQLAERDQKEQSAQVETAYNAVISHAGPAIDSVLKPLVAKLGLTAEGYQALRNDVWNHLQDTRNADATYKTVAPAKQKQGYSQWTEYAKRWTQDNAEASARAMVKARYGHQLQNGAVQKPVTSPPGVTPIQKGKEPLPSEIDYSVKGKIAAQKAGFKDIADMILSGKAPLKAGGIRQWR